MREKERGKERERLIQCGEQTEATRQREDVERKERLIENTINIRPNTQKVSSLQCNQPRLLKSI